MLMRNRKWVLSEQGFTVVETLVALSILLIALVGLVPMFLFTIRVSAAGRAKTVAQNIAASEMEKIRGMDYDNVGTNPGNPSGTLDADKEQTVGGLTYNIETEINWVDDDFDGLYPDDVLPTDYKEVIITVTCPSIALVKQVISSSFVAREGEETIKDKGNIRVFVNDASGDPVTDVVVNLTGDATLSDNTDQAGSVLFAGLEPSAGEDYTISVSKQTQIGEETVDYINYEGDTSPSQTAQVVLDQTTDVFFILDIPGGLTVHLVNSQTLELINRESQLTLENATYGTLDFSSSDGNFDITNLFPAFFDLTASASGYEPASQTVQIEAGTIEEITIPLDPLPTGTLHVFVFDEGGAPLSPADVKITDQSSGDFLEYQTDIYGEVVDEFSVATYTVEVSMAGYIDQSDAVTVLDGGEETLNFYLLVAPSYGSILVRTQRYSGSPRSNVWVRVQGPGGYEEQKRTDSNGEALFDSLEPGSYTVSRWRWGWRDYRDVTLTSGEQEVVTYQY